MRISDWSSDVCSSDLHLGERRGPLLAVGSVAVVALVAVVPTAIVDRAPLIDFAAAEELEDELLEQAERPTTSTTRPTEVGAPSTPAPAGPPPRIAVFADSTAPLFLPGLLRWGQIDRKSVASGTRVTVPVNLG